MASCLGAAVLGFAAILSSALLAKDALPGGAPREAVSLDQGWRFKQSADLTGAESPTFDDAGWQPMSMVRAGSLDIEFKPSRGRALVCALSITPLEKH